MEKIILFCKSYDRDMLRARRMAKSIQRFNLDHIPLYMSVPAKDLTAFKNCFKNISCIFLSDEQILRASQDANGNLPTLFPSHLLQQLIKLEFWRMALCKNYCWIDSDSYFIKPFQIKDLMASDDVPYTVQHDNHELLNFAEKVGSNTIKEDFDRMATKFRDLFGRDGQLLSFASPPLIWSSKVLHSLSEDYLAPKGVTIYDLLEYYPCEMHLYGEYLHYSAKIPIIPHREYFRVYHFAEQFFQAQELGENEQEITKDYFGVIFQSNWARLTEQKRPPSKRLKRFFRNLLRQIRDIALKKRKTLKVISQHRDNHSTKTGYYVSG